MFYPFSIQIQPVSIAMSKLNGLEPPSKTCDSWVEIAGKSQMVDMVIVDVSSI
jgi:hypothetical protein